MAGLSEPMKHRTLLFKKNKTMKKLLSIILVFVSISTFTQKKPVKKTASLQIPKPIVTKEVDIPPPPPSHKSVGYPKVSVAPTEMNVPTPSLPYKN